MNIEEYKQWLEKNANKEERLAYKVVEVIINYHQYQARTYNYADIFPRKKLNGVEFDLLIHLKSDSDRRDILIGVEFKETDMPKVIRQAIVRKEFVDYMYIATNCRAWEVEDLFLLTLYGIGWIFWDDEFIKMILKAKRHASKVDVLINHLISKIVNERIEREVVKKIQKKLDDIWG